MKAMNSFRDLIRYQKARVAAREVFAWFQEIGATLADATSRSASFCFRPTS